MTQKVAKQRAVKTNRPEAVERGIKVATLLRAGIDHRRLGLELSEEKEGELLDDLQNAPLVNEADIFRLTALTGSAIPHPPTEIQIKYLQDLANGLQQKEIANRYDRTVINIHKVLTNLKTSLGVNSLYEAIAMCTEAGLIKGKPLPEYKSRGWIKRHPKAKPLITPRHLSNKHRQVVSRILKGMEDNAIVEELNITPKTFRNYMKQLYEIYEVRSRTALIVKLVRNEGGE